MSAIQTLPADSLTLAWEVDVLCDRYEEALRQGAAADLDAWLPADEPLRGIALLELARVELEHRLRAGAAACAADYFARYPELAADTAQAEQLRTAEQRVRQALPEGPLTAGTENDASLNDSSPAVAAAQELDRTGELFEFLAPPQEQGEIGRLGPYRVLRLLGAGGMGVVFLAEDPSLRRLVALKALKPLLANSTQARQRFVREAQATAALKHDHTVTIYQVGEDRGVPYLVMELLEGETLDARIKRDSRLPPDEVLRIGREIAEGLAAAHARGLTHRDIKPANIWLEGAPGASEPPGLSRRSSGGRVKLLDFGLARGSGDDTQLTQPGLILGTPAYMSPEQAAGQATDPRSDLFSLGAVLYQLATGETPFAGKTPLDVLNALATRFPQPVGELNPAVPESLAELIMRLLAKDPQQRPASAQVVVQALQEIETGLRDQAVSSLPGQDCGANPEALRRTPQPLLVCGWFIGLVLVALLVVGYSFGGTLIRFATNKGVLVVEVDRSAAEIVVKEDGIQVCDRTSRREFVLTAGDGEVEVYEKESGLKLATKEFTLVRGGRTTVRVLLNRPLPPPMKPDQPKEDGDTERRSAEWVLSLGGRITIRADGKEQQVHLPAGLPAGKWQLVGIHLSGNPKVSDAGLAHFKGLTNLRYLDLENKRVSDTGLENLKGLPNLTTLTLAGTDVSNDGLEHLKGLANLRILDLTNTDVGDGGMEHLKGLPNLRTLSLGNTKVGDRGLAHLKECPNLVFLGLASTRVSNEGLAHFKGSYLQQLILDDTQVSDAGLEHLKRQIRLWTLSLNGTQVSNAGLAHLKGLTNLHSLCLNGTPVSDTGLAHLKGLTNCQWLSLNGTQVSDAGLEYLKGIVDLHGLHLNDTQVSDGGLKHIKGLTSLESLHLNGTKVTDDGLESLKGLPNLGTLYLNGTQVSDAGLKQLKGLTTYLTQLDLRGTRVTAAGTDDLRKALSKCNVLGPTAK